MLCGGQHTTSWNCQKTAKLLKLQGWYVMVCCSSKARGATAYPFDNTRMMLFSSILTIPKPRCHNAPRIWNRQAAEPLCLGLSLNLLICGNTRQRHRTLESLEGMCGKSCWKVQVTAKVRLQNRKDCITQLQSATATPSSRVASQESRILTATETAITWSCKKISYWVPSDDVIGVALATTSVVMYVKGLFQKVYGNTRDKTSKARMTLSKKNSSRWHILNNVIVVSCHAFEICCKPIGAVQWHRIGWHGDTNPSKGSDLSQSEGHWMWWQIWKDLIMWHQLINGIQSQLEHFKASLIMVVVQALFSSTYVGLWCIGTAIVKQAVVAQAWVDLCYATNQQAVQKSHEFTRLRMQVHLQVQLVLHHLDCQDVMMKFHPMTKCCCCPYNSGMQLWIMSTFGISSFLLKVSVCNVHKHHRASPAYPPSPPPPPLSRASRAARMASHVNLLLLRNGILAQFDLAIDLVPGMDLRTMPSHPLLPDEKVYPLQFIPKHASCDVTVDPPVA